MAPALTESVSGPDFAPQEASLPAETPDAGVEPDLLQLKTRPAPVRSKLVPRERLVRRLLDARQVPVALIVAPAGYGKTTLLSQWSEADERPFAWVTLDEDDNDPKNLVSAIALALDAVEPVGWEVFEPLSSRRRYAAQTALKRLTGALARWERPVVLALEDAHVLRTSGSRKVVASIWQALGAGLQLAIASRGDPVLPMGRLRAHGRSVELRADDLAMTRSEASTLLQLAGLDLSREEALTLTHRTEGWAAGLQLAALSLRAQDHPGVEEFAGDDRFVADYFREELLSGLPPKELEFLTRTSILDRLSAPLCDHLTGREDSAGVLARLARSNVLIAPLDRRDHSYRYHALFANALRAELRRREPGRDVELHRRASDWRAEHGDTPRAIAHAIDAHDLERAGRLLWSTALQHAAPGQEQIIWRWLGHFTEDELARTPLLALVAAATSIAGGDVYEAERWTTVAESAADEGGVAQGGVALMRAAIGRGAVTDMLANASSAYELLDDAGPWLSMCGFLRGVALHLAGDRAEAQRWLTEGAHRAAASAPLVQALCLAQLALLAADEGDPDRAAALAERAIAQVRRSGLDQCPSAALALAVSAELRAQRGQAAEATDELGKALTLLAAITDPAHWYEAECRIVLGRATVRQGGPAPARDLLAAAARSAERVEGAPALRGWLEDASAEVAVALSRTRDADWSLTAAELRVLRFLPSHLSVREIAERLYVSPNTVKTHARGIYRKLGVSSRGKAVERARQAGLVDRFVGHNA